MNNNISAITAGIQNAYIDSSINSNLAYSPQFLTNNYQNGTKVLTYIESELMHCDEFAISVAFISRSGFVALSQTLKELEIRGIRGRILTTDYLTFSDPYALDRLAELSNVELKLYHVSEAGVGFHTKGYLFKEEETYRIIIGSSNMTQTALTTNMEWNTALVSTEQGAMAKAIINEFESLWNDASAKDYADISEMYRKQYDRKKQIDRLISAQHKVALEDDIVDFETYELKPNKMQEAFVGNIHEMRENGAKRALLISATGTGKTYASAFALKNENPGKALFIVHRELIAKQAMKSYRKVFGRSKKMALLSGNSKEYDADILFATMNMMAKQETFDYMEQHNINYDWICIDEVHRAGAESYQRIMNHFKPDFWLGMTASPERTDGFDIFALFDHNIAYEIRLQHALRDDLLCPFHYFGITDIEIDGDVISNETELHNFRYLVSEQRVNHILDRANYYGHSGDRVKGLVFCSSKREARELAEKFAKKGYYARALVGEDSESIREECIDLLAKDVEENELASHLTDIKNGKSANTEDLPFLDYIFTIDIFNEGVDIPEINQVLMLRETQSPIVFVQQLGRGLRKAENKDYVVIIDFIGNYTNNYMIPIALSGDRTYNKDNIRRFLMEGGKVIPGASTVHFDEISRTRIFESIDRMKTTLKMLTEKYNVLKERLGHIPSIVDFYLNGEIDPMLFVAYSKSYDQFVRKVDKEYKITFSEDEEKVLEYVSNIIMNGKRIHELLMFQMLIDKGDFSIRDFKDKLTSLGENFKTEDYNSAYHVITNDFINSKYDKSRYCDIEFVDKQQASGSFAKRVFSFYEKLNNHLFQKELKSLIEYGTLKYRDSYAAHDDNNLVLYEKYSRKDVCRLLNWDKDESSTIYGYRIKHDTCPIFVTYEKAEDISSSTKYPDEFERISTNPLVFSKKIFSWMTRSRVSQNSSEAQQIIHSKENGLKILLFLKKSDGEGSDFYYMGEADPVSWSQTTISNDKNEILPIMNFKLELKQEVRKDLFDYFTT